MKSSILILALCFAGAFQQPAFALQPDKSADQSSTETIKSKKVEKNGLELTVSGPAKAKPGSEFELELAIKIPKDFHIYGATDPTYPTKVKVKDNASVEPGKASIPVGISHRKSGGGVNFWLERRQKIRQPIKVKEDAKGELKLEGHLDFMICDAKSCKPPAKLAFEFVVAINSPQLPKEATSTKVAFESPTRVEADGKPIAVEEPGYACPSLADLNGDGTKDLLVGQFNEGRIKVYPGLGKGKFGKGEWLKADGEIASVPGVW